MQNRATICTWRPYAQSLLATTIAIRAAYVPVLVASTVQAGSIHRPAITIGGGPLQLSSLGLRVGGHGGGSRREPGRHLPAAARAAASRASRARHGQAGEKQRLRRGAMRIRPVPKGGRAPEDVAPEAPQGRRHAAAKAPPRRRRARRQPVRRVVLAARLRPGSARGAAACGHRGEVQGGDPRRAMDPPAATVASSVLALGLAPCAPRALALDLTVTPAGRGPAGASEAAPCCQDHPTHQLTARAAPPQQGPGGSEAPALQRFRGHVLRGLAAVRQQGRCSATESLLFPGLTVASPRRSGGSRPGGGGKVTPRGTAISTTMASDEWAGAGGLDGGWYQQGDARCP